MNEKEVMEETEITEEPGNGLPAFVVLNTAIGGMWDDTLRSGINLRQWPTRNEKGEMVRHDMAKVPATGNLSGLKQALDRGIVLPCNIKGENKLLPPPMIQENGIKNLMGKNSKELMAITDQLRDIRLLQNMIDFEAAKPPKVRRDILLAYMRERAKSNDVVGTTDIRNEQAMIYDREKKAMVPDELGIV